MANFTLIANESDFFLETPDNSTFLNGSVNLSVNNLTNDSLPRNVNVFNQTIPDTAIYNNTWVAYGIFLVFLTIYSLAVAYHIFATIFDSQKGVVGKVCGAIMALIVVILLLGIGIALRWLTLVSSDIILMIIVLLLDIIVCVIELLWLCLKSAFSANAAVCNLMFLMTMDITEVIIVTIMMQEVRNWCHDLDVREGSVCYDGWT